MSQTAAQLVCPVGPTAAFLTSVAFHERLRVLLQSWPHSLTLKLYEVTKPARLLALATKTLLAEVPLVVPGAPGHAPAEASARGYDWASLANAGLPLPSAGRPSGSDGAPRLEPLRVVQPAGACKVPNWPHCNDDVRGNSTAF